MSLATTRGSGTTLYTVWLELEGRRRGDTPTFTVREQGTRHVAYGPTTDKEAAHRACMRLNDGKQKPRFNVATMGGKR